MNICIHYGFGDYVVCYGMIAELAKREPINLFAIEHCSPLHIENIKRLYSTIPNVTIITDPPGIYPNVVKFGFEDFNDQLAKNPNIRNQDYFYNKAGVPINLLWDNFKFRRNRVKEKEAYYDKLGLTDGEDYIVLHDDPGRGYAIKQKYITPGIRVVHLIDHQDISILDTLYLIEHCRELHTMNTGLVPFVDQMKIQHNSLNYHKYTRPIPHEQPILTMKWNIIEK